MAPRIPATAYTPGGKKLKYGKSVENIPQFFFGLLVTGLLPDVKENCTHREQMLALWHSIRPHEVFLEIFVPSPIWPGRLYYDPSGPRYGYRYEVLAAALADQC